MEQRAKVQLHESCVIPYRVTEAGVEFCLVTPVAENRWEFPKIAIDCDTSISLLPLDEAAALAGLRGNLQRKEPLGQYVASRGNEARSMVGFLMQITGVDDSWPQQLQYRRRWCLAEEARVRIRRKPLRRFIDMALRCVEGEARA